MRTALRFFALSICLWAAALIAQAVPHVSQVSLTALDTSGAAIPGASVHVSPQVGEDRQTDGQGNVTLPLPAGSYDITIKADNFRERTMKKVLVLDGRTTPLSAVLVVAGEDEVVEVSGEEQVSNDSSSNKSALVFKGDKLDTLSDDPEMMQQQLTSLAGGDPTNPPQLYVDGFAHGDLPPKESIREIRVNQNPFSPYYDQFGGGRIEVFTKPGANKLHGNIASNFGAQALNANNPYAASVLPYTNYYLDGGVNGPLGKNSSFYFTWQQRGVSANQVINATVLDSSLNPVNVQQTIANKRSVQNDSIRLDHQFGKKNTLIGRYSYSSVLVPASGAGQLVLASQAYRNSVRTDTFQLTDTHIFSPKVVLDSAVQYLRSKTSSDATSNTPSLIVQGSFSSGSNTIQQEHDHQDRIELREEASISLGNHYLRTGLRYRWYHDSNLSRAGYNGQFIFPSLTAYRITLDGIQRGLTPAAIRAAGGGATQFSLTAGTPTAEVNTADLGVYFDDEWKLNRNFTLNLGIRFESQTAIPDHFDPAPRAGFAWSVLHHGKAKEPFFVIRGGFGIFYQRFDAGNILRTYRQNGVTQQAFIVQNPDFYPNIPPASSLPQYLNTVYRLDPNLRSPMQMQGMVSVDHSLGKYGSISVQYYQRKSTHQWTSLNINAPLPGTYDPSNPNSGVRPLGGNSNLYQFSSNGLSEGHSLGINGNFNVTKSLNVWSFIGVARQEGNVNFSTSSASGFFPSNSYNLGADYGRLAGFSPIRYFGGANWKPGWGTAFNVFMSAWSQSNFNITTGTDLNGDAQYNDRPAFATDLTRSSVVRTAWGNFDTKPMAGQTIIPINYGTAPGLFYMELYFNKNFYFGKRPESPKDTAKEKLPQKPYRFQVGIGADNLLNTNNPGAPVGVLSSPYFGRSISLNTPFTNNSAANRALLMRGAFFF
ncbi:carboxypeptidase regulatory-like domain-containing protein [Terriglobus sp. 2YAB30_2]|uniref:TonB-dependent receptor n=2 Tax=unclassified Terriglobus TaxID=2628988 RepID=UPI003F977ECF